MSRDHYQLLGVEPDADRRTIRAAYRKALHRHHPDANAGSRAGEQILLQVITAGRILSNQKLRARYDQQRAVPLAQSAPQPSVAKAIKPFGYHRLLLNWIKTIHSGTQACREFFSAEHAKATEARAAQQRKRSSPGFNFYLHRAMTRNNRSTYQCDADGIYRKSSHRPSQTRAQSWRNRTAVWLLIGIMLWRI